MFPLFIADLLIIPNVEVCHPETEEEHGVKELGDGLGDDGAGNVNVEIRGTVIEADIECGQSVYIGHHQRDDKRVCGIEGQVTVPLLEEDNAAALMEGIGIVQNERNVQQKRDGQ